MGFNTVTVSVQAPWWGVESYLLKVSIQWLCRFKSPCNVNVCLLQRVSIQWLCRFKFTGFSFGSGDDSFNTVTVSVQAKNLMHSLMIYFCFNTVTVSVQGVNTLSDSAEEGMFQYSDCVGSRQCTRIRYAKNNLFQYSDCVGSRGY